MSTGEAITATLTAVLVAITGYYAWQTYRMVEEMEKARAVAVLPRLALKWLGVGPTLSFIRVASVGPGPALDVDVEVIFVPKTDPAAELRRRIQTSLMAPGEAE